MQIERTSTVPPSVPPPGRTRLRIEGVRAPIVTTVARRRPEGYVVVQDLPFLKLNASVQEDDDRKARISRVAVDVEHDTPRLVLELAYEEELVDEPIASPIWSARRRRREPTMGYDRRDLMRSEAPPPTTSSAPPPDRTTPVWMEKRGSELELALRSLVHRIAAALDALASGFTNAVAALRSNP